VSPNEDAGAGSWLPCNHRRFSDFIHCHLVLNKNNNIATIKQNGWSKITTTWEWESSYLTWTTSAWIFSWNSDSWTPGQQFKAAGSMGYASVLHMYPPLFTVHFQEDDQWLCSLWIKSSRPNGTNKNLTVSAKKNDPLQSSKVNLRTIEVLFTSWLNKFTKTNLIVGWHLRRDIQRIHTQFYHYIQSHVQYLLLPLIGKDLQYPDTSAWQIQSILDELDICLFCMLPSCENNFTFTYFQLITTFRPVS